MTNKIDINTVNEEPDTVKKYLCIYCTGIIEFSLPSKARLEMLYDKGKNLNPEWRHIATGDVNCRTRAIPSNVEFPAPFKNDYIAPEVREELGRKASWEV